MGVSKASLRGLRMPERMEKIREANNAMVKTVRVSPANDDMRRLLKHPRAGGFPKSGGAVWPDDRFTQRRIADGNITRESDKKVEADDRDRGKRPAPDEPQRSGDEPNNAA
jgi:hypothetical protein